MTKHQSYSTRTTEAGVHRIGAEQAPPSEILASFRRGDDRAAGALYDRYADKVNALVWRIMGPDDAHDDMVQKVFVNILSSLKRLNNPEALDAWVSRVVANTCRVEIRHRTYRRRVRFMSTPPEVSSHAEGPKTRAFIAQFYRALDQLAVNDRICLVLHDLEKYTLPEVAEMQAVSIATVKRRVRKAKTALKEVAEKTPALMFFLAEVSDDR